ncbi:carbonic anhydrase [Nonomuraea typhae]|uniref:Carbonic anhydrase n=1 Tax=Nonomuraea typhae TaxID=2603600 RepID=A0ABW7Z614_9ACTN
MRDREATRRQLVVNTGVVLGAAMVSGGAFAGGVALGRSGAAVPEEDRPATAGEAWAALMRGNRRWAAGSVRHPRQSAARRRAVAGRQEPFAVVVSCVDSRVPPEVVFDTGVGDLLVVRTAAHTVDPLVTGAIQYGPADLLAPLVVVLGHRRCGAVAAAARALAAGTTLPGQQQRIVEALKPVYSPDVEQMIAGHTRATVTRLRADPLLRRARVVGARYDLDTGEVVRLV